VCVVLAILSSVAPWAGSRAFAQSKDDPFLGRWTLDRAKSEFSGAPPERRVAVFELLPDGSMKHVTETVIANGSTDRVEYTYKYDGKDNPIQNSFMSTVAVKRINPRSNERTGKVRGEVVETSMRTVSADGKTLTITIKGSNDGTEYSSTQVFRRE
jgi:hypothetical protein